MGYKTLASIPVTTVGGAGITVATSSGRFLCGFYLNGSADGTTLTIKNGSTTIITTSAAAAILLCQPFCVPVICSSGIVATCSGTGSYTLFVSE